MTEPECINTTYWNRKKFSPPKLTPENRYEGEFRIRVLHMNDMHNTLLPRDWDDELCDPYDSKGGCRGGLARLATALYLEKQNHPDAVTVVLDGGDFLNGREWANAFQGREMAALMDYLGIDVFTLGPGDFNFGTRHLGDFIRKTESSDLALCNADFSQDPHFYDIETARYKQLIREVPGTGKYVTVSVVPLTTQEVTEISSPGEVRIFDPKTVLPDCIQEASREADVLIILSHNSMSSIIDTLLLPDAAGVHMLVAGADHYVFGSLEMARYPYPTYVFRYDERVVPIASAGYLTKFYGYGDLWLERKDNVMQYLNYSGDNAEIVADVGAINYMQPSCEVEAIIQQFDDELESVQSEPVAYVMTALVAREGDGSPVSRETNYGNLICDAYIWRTTLLEGLISTESVVAIKASEAMLSDINTGVVSRSEVVKSIQASSFLHFMQCSGLQIRRAIEEGLDPWDNTAFLQVGGMRVVYDGRLRTSERVMTITVQNTLAQTWSSLNETGQYFVVSDGNLGADGKFHVLQDCSKSMLPYLEADTIANYLRTLDPVDYRVDGRLTDARLNAPSGGAFEISGLPLLFLSFLLFFMH